MDDSPLSESPFFWNLSNRSTDCKLSLECLTEENFPGTNSLERNLFKRFRLLKLSLADNEAAFSCRSLLRWFESCALHTAFSAIFVSFVVFVYKFTASSMGEESASTSGIQKFKAASVFNRKVSSMSSCILARRSIDRRSEPYFPGFREVTTKLSNSFLFERRYFLSRLRRGDLGPFDNCEKSKVCRLLMSSGQKRA